MVRPGPGSDEALLRAVAVGDVSALTQLYERHAGALFGYLYRLAGDRMTAEEILQDTMLAVWRSAAAFEGRSKATTWIFGVARRQAHNRLRIRSGPETIGVPRSIGPTRAPALTSWRSRRRVAHRWPRPSTGCPTTTAT